MGGSIMLLAFGLILPVPIVVMASLTQSEVVKGWIGLEVTVFMIAGFIPYILEIFRGKGHPSRATWIIWAGIDAITFFGMLAKGALSWQIATALGCACFILVLSFKYGKPGWTKVDKICLGTGLASIAAWLLLGSPVAGIVGSLIAGGIGGIPTIVSVWEDPTRESFLAWMLLWASALFAIAAIPRWDLANASAPAIFWAIATVMVFILLFRPQQLAELARRKT